MWEESNLKNKILLLLGVLSFLMLTGCTFGGRAIMFSSDDSNAERRMKQIISALKEQNKDAIKELFSEKATDEAENFDQGIDNLFDYFQGNVESWDKDSLNSEGSNQYGYRSVLIHSYYIVTTDQAKYLFYIADYSKNTIDPDNQGVYTLSVIKAEDDEPESGYIWEDDMIPGVCVPTK